MKVYSFHLIAIIAVALMVQACGPTAEEIRNKEKEAHEATLKKQQAEIMVYEAMELIKSQSQAIARGENITPVTTASLEEEPVRPPAPATSINTVSSSPQGTYTIQVASVTSRENAERELNTWKQRGFNDAFLSQNNNTYRIRLGRYDTERTAQNLATRVNSEYNISAWVDRIRASQPASPERNPRYTVQVAAVDSRAAANQEINKWKERGFNDAHSEVTQQRGYTYFRVRVGRYETKEEAERIIAQVADQFRKEAVVFEL